MRTDWSHLEVFRQSPPGYESKFGDKFGWFVWLNGKTQIRALAVDGENSGWEHVSVTVAYRAGKTWIVRDPKWEEMIKIKQAFWEPGECVVQYHPPESEYVNIHEHCLHLWRAVDEVMPMPPKEFV